MARRANQVTARKSLAQKCQGLIVIASASDPDSSASFRGASKRRARNPSDRRNAQRNGFRTAAFAASGNDDALRSAKGVKNDALRHAMPLRDKPGPTLFLQQRWTPDQQRNTSVALRPRNAIRTARHSGARVQRANPESRDSGSDAYAPSRNDQKADRRRCTISPAPERTQSCAISTLWAAPQIMGTILNPA